MDEHNAAGLRRDENHQAAVSSIGGEKTQQNLKEELESLKKDREIEKLKFEKEIETLKAVIEKLKLENTMEKLKSENTFLKAEKQFGIDLKAISDDKQNIEEELKSAKIENAKFRQQNENLIEENKRFEENLKEVEAENQNFIQENTTLKANEAKITDELKTLKMEKTQMLDSIQKLKEKNKKKENKGARKKQFQKAEVLKTAEKNEVNKDEEPDYSRMPLEESILSGSYMIFEEEFYPGYENWYTNMYKRSNFYVTFKNCRVHIKHFIKTNIYINIEWTFDNLKCAKLLHPKDNRKSKDLDHIGGKEWMTVVNGLTEEFRYEGFVLILIMRNSNE
eukprot:TCONS_00050767-protein